MKEDEMRAGLMLAYIVLPQGILDYFTLVKSEEKESQLTTSEADKRCKYDSIWSELDIHIYLDENDNRSDEEKSQLRANGFTEESVTQDFPIRDRKVFLHIRRRRWLDKEGKNVILNVYPIVAKGTRLSPQFGAFLKGTDGQISSECAAAWGILQD